MNIESLPASVVEWLRSRGANLLLAGQGEKNPLFEAGRVYEARILQNLGNGRHVVQVDQQPLNMSLPREAKVGDAVRLLYLKSEPRPTFLLVPPRDAPEQSVRISDAAVKIAALSRWAGTNAPAPVQSAAQAAPQASAGPAAATQAGVAAAQTAAQLGAQAAIVAKAAPDVPLQAAPGQVPPGQPLVQTAGSLAAQAQAAAGARLLAQAELPAPAATAAKPAILLNAPPDDAQALVGPLKQAVKESGVFYESHLGKWVRGEQGLASIQREPQARLAEVAAQARVAELDGMPEDAARLAGRQLQMLDGQPFVWHGLAWPGQAMHWQLEERQGGGAGEEDIPQWHTELRLTLPRLGGVHADLALLPYGLRLRLRAEDAGTEATMREALPELAGRLDAAGVAVLGLLVESAQAAGQGRAASQGETGDEQAR